MCLTKEKLEQIFYIDKEIRMWQKELEKLRSRSLAKASPLTGLPRQRGGLAGGIADYAADLVDIEAVLTALLVKAQLQQKEILDYIDKLEDSLMKQIIYYRNVCCLTWNEVARGIGGNNSEESVKKIYSRFVQKL